MCWVPFSKGRWNLRRGECISVAVLSQCYLLLGCMSFALKKRNQYPNGIYLYFSIWIIFSGMRCTEAQRNVNWLSHLQQGFSTTSVLASTTFLSTISQNNCSHCCQKWQGCCHQRCGTATSCPRVHHYPRHLHFQWGWSRQMKCHTVIKATRPHWCTMKNQWLQIHLQKQTVSPFPNQETRWWTGAKKGNNGRKAIPLLSVTCTMLNEI